ncbi:hypothetical protein SERLA73DRAFT_128626 [Serpula lacrymans var. lacrymans S7.3]|uniref:Uncharacterized protein n=1 Tax=Serpula lacrymans var. lacrymans (strain S7.3) TaxID=936435 RepID=F8PI67_SERL3|nr:hypothetical protein SERLA73DRAFT_128626 [Serpula lacrymans var. lacrymans S7.3]
MGLASDLEHKNLQLLPPLRSRSPLKLPLSLFTVTHYPEMLLPELEYLHHCPLMTNPLLCHL